MPTAATPAPRPVTPALVAVAGDAETAVACCDAGADEVFLRACSSALPDSVPEGIGVSLPRVATDAEAERALDRLTEGTAATAGNLGLLAGAAARGVRTEADWSLNVTNPWAAAVVAEMGARRIWLSPELSARDLAAVAAGSPVPVGTIVHGRQEVMVTDHCVLEVTGLCEAACASCGLRVDPWELEDAKGHRFPVWTDPDGRSRIYNSVPLDLTHRVPLLLEAGVAAVRVDLPPWPEEDAGTVIAAVRDRLVRAASARGAECDEEPLASPSTTGHLFRGVE